VLCPLVERSLRRRTWEDREMRQVRLLLRGAPSRIGRRLAQIRAIAAPAAGRRRVDVSLSEPDCRLRTDRSSCSADVSVLPGKTSRKTS